MDPEHDEDEEMEEKMMVMLMIIMVGWWSGDSSDSLTLGDCNYLPTGNWRPARALLETAFCFVFPESFPALPPAMVIKSWRKICLDS